MRRMPREALPVHVDTMPANEIDRLVIPMADFAARVDFSVARHAAPRIARRSLIGRNKPVVLSNADACRVLTADHHGHAATPHHLAADVRFAARAAAERFVAMDHGALFGDAGLWNKEPLTLPDCPPAFDLLRPQACDCRPHVANVLAGHGSGKPVALIVSKQEFVFEQGTGIGRWNFPRNIWSACGGGYSKGVHAGGK